MRGRKPIPDEIKELKGNPGKRRLALDSARPESQALVEFDDRSGIEVPAYLTGELERGFYKSICDEYFPRRIVRRTDKHVVARWASLLERWVNTKKSLDGINGVYKVESQHGTYLRLHPLLLQMSRLNRELLALETHIGLTPLSRQSVIQAMTRPQPVDLFDTKDEIAEDELAEEEGPLNFLGDARTVN